jgi:hypothetical protein
MATNTNVNTNNPTVNADTLEVFYGNNEAQVDLGGYVSTMIGPEHVLEFNVGFANVALGTADTSNFVLSYNNWLPQGCIPTKCEFIVTTAWDSGDDNFNLEVGTIRHSDYEIIDADGLMNTVDQTVLDLAGNIVKAVAAGSDPDGTYTGAQLGTVLASDQLVTVHYTTSAPTAGAGILKVYYMANAAA